MKLIKPFFTVLIALLGSSFAVQAQTLGVQLWTSGNLGPGDTSAALTSGQTAGVVPQDHFNTFNLSDYTYGDGTMSLVDSSGASTLATFTIANNSDIYSTGTETATPNATLLSGQSGDYAYSPATYTFSGLAAGTYDLIAYTVTNATGQTAEFSLTTGSTSGPTNYFDLEQNGADFTGSFIQGTATSAGAAATANYVEFTGVTPVGGTLTITLPQQGAIPYVDAINGFELVEVPEPSTVFLFAAGALLLLGAGWKYRQSSRC